MAHSPHLGRARALNADRFFFVPQQLQGVKVTFTPQQAWQLARVLRRRPGQRVRVLDNHGSCHQVD